MICLGIDRSITHVYSRKGKKGQGNGSGPKDVGLRVNERRRKHVAQWRISERGE